MTEEKTPETPEEKAEQQKQEAEINAMEEFQRFTLYSKEGVGSMIDSIAEAAATDDQKKLHYYRQACIEQTSIVEVLVAMSDIASNRARVDTKQQKSEFTKMYLAAKKQITEKLEFIGPKQSGIITSSGNLPPNKIIM